MKKTITLIAGLLLLLVFAQCKKDKEKEQNIQLTDDIIEYIDASFQSQLETLSDMSTPEVMQGLATWIRDLEGVTSAVASDDFVEISYVDGTQDKIVVYDQSIDSDFDSDSKIAMPAVNKQMGSAVGSQTGFIYDAFPELSSVYNPGDSVQKRFEEYGFEYVHPRKEDCTIDTLKSMFDYGFVFLQTHGEEDVLATGEKTSRRKRELYRESIESGLITQRWCIIRTILNEFDYYGRFFAVTTRFFEQLPGRFDNTVVFNGACRGYAENTSMKDAFLTHGAATYFGFSDDVPTKFVFATSNYIVMCLLYGYNIGYPYDEICNNDMKCYDFTYHFADRTTCLEIAGSHDVTWYDYASIPTGGVNGLFTVNGHGGKVCFAHGNLQYQASTNTWRFAPNQYDHIGADNAYASSSYSGWIDLFCWGTSGWNSGAQEYQPYSQSTSYQSYYTGGSPDIDLTGEYADADWAYHNPISNGGQQAGLWRCLTHEEYIYLMENRADASQKYGYACVNGVNGLVILPDIWSLPDGLRFTPRASSWNTNNYTVEEWTRMESSGAVFLPTTGTRQGTYIFYVDGLGDYWASTANDAETGHSMSFFNGNVYPGDCRYRFLGTSVRPVHAL